MRRIMTGHKLVFTILAFFVFRLGFGNIETLPIGPEITPKGTTFRVWAPHAASVEVMGDFNGWSAGRDVMENADPQLGIWETHIRGAKHGKKYQFLINGNIKKRDPCGMAVNTGGSASKLYDHTVFNWKGDVSPKVDPSDLVLYELHPGTFYDPQPNDGKPGTFYDAIKRLPYLKELGINGISLMPVHEFNGQHSWGYNPSDVYAVEQAYGGPDGLKTFVQACHRLGMVVHLDIVHNHYGPENLDLLQFDGTGPVDRGGIYFYDGPGVSMTPWGPRPKFETPQVRQFIRHNVDMWLRDYHIDGFRWDSTINIRAYNMGQDSLPAGAKMLDDLNDYIHKTYPGRLSIAEDSVDIGRFDGSWEYDFHHEIMPVFSARSDEQRDMNAVVDAMSRTPNSMYRVIYTDNHDEAGKINGQQRIANDIDPTNPSGEFATKLSGLASLLTLTAPGIPLLFMGNEMQETGPFHDDLPLHWGNRKRHAGLVRLHKELIALRRNLKGTGHALKGSGIQFVEKDQQNNTLVYWRWHENNPQDKMIVALNLSAHTQEIITLFPSRGRWTTCLNTSWDMFGGKVPVGNNRPFDIPKAGAKIRMKLPLYSARIFSLLERPTQETQSVEASVSTVKTPEPETAYLTMYYQIALAANFNRWSPTNLSLRLVGDYRWEGRFELPAHEQPSIQLLANGTNIVRWGLRDTAPLSVPINTTLHWQGPQTPLAPLSAGAYLVRFHEETKQFEIIETERPPQQPKKKPILEEVPAYRVWTSKRGKKIKASFLKYENKKIYLMTPKEKQLVIPVSALTREDILFLRKVISK